jgi:putative hydrolase of the HAD superfamily
VRFVFDFGSVLFRWRPNLLMQRTLPRHAVDEASAAHWVAQVFQAYGGDWGEFDRGTLGAAEVRERIVARTGLAEGEVQRVMDEIPHELAPIPETVDLLARLRQAGDPMYYLSNMPAPYADHLEREHDFIGWFADGVFSARVQLIKPEPAIFDLSARQFGVAPERLVFLDDNAHNIEAARAAGWRAVQFHDAAQAERALRESGWWPPAVD